MLQEALKSKNIPAPHGCYSQGIRLGDFIYLSAQLPLEKGETEAKGSIEEQTEKCMKNIQALLAAQNLTLSHILKMDIFLTEINDYQKMNDTLEKFLAEPFPSRNVCGVNALPSGARIQIGCFAVDTRALEVMCADDHCDEDGGFCSCK